jgi:hypothetical protein
MVGRGAYAVGAGAEEEDDEEDDEESEAPT